MEKSTRRELIKVSGVLGIALIVFMLLGTGISLLVRRIYAAEILPKTFTVECLFQVLYTVLAILLPFSPTAVAFFGIYYKLQSFLFMPMNGLGQAAIPVIGCNYGAKRFDRIRETSRISEIAAICMAIVGTCVFLIFPKQLLVIFSASDAMLGIGVRALRIIAISFPAAACTMIFGYLCSGFGDGLTNMVSSILRQFFPLIPAAWLLARFNGISVVWYAIWISEICGMVYACFRMRKRFNTIS